MKLLSATANHLLQACAQEVGISLDGLVGEFEAGLKGEVRDYNCKLVEFCSSKALQSVLHKLEDRIGDGSLSKLTFDMMLAWESLSPVDEESVAKEREDLYPSMKSLVVDEQDDVSLFYSDIVPLLQADDQKSIGEHAFVWLARLFPLVADVVNAQFTFEALTATTHNRLYYPAYDLLIKEIYKHINHSKLAVGLTGVELGADEVVLLVDGTGSAQRVIRRIGETSWPGRLTLTNYALYFEASGVISYENAIKIDLSKHDTNHQITPASTGPWGAPLFDKALIYESSNPSEKLVLEFPEVTSSMRRDYWLTLVKEVILLHNFFSSFKVEAGVGTWEMHCRTILEVYRLQAVREILRLSSPAPTSFLIFSLYDNLPKGDYVLQELANYLKQSPSSSPFAATRILESLNIKFPNIYDGKHIEGYEELRVDSTVDESSLETAINQVKREAEETCVARASTEKLKEEGLNNSVLILLELLIPCKSFFTTMREIVKWEKPAVTLLAMLLILMIIYKEWIGYAISATLLGGTAKLLWSKENGVHNKCGRIVIDATSELSAMETLVSAQHRMLKLQEAVQRTNIFIMKMWSVLTWKAPKHAKQVMMGMVGAAVFFAFTPLKFILMGITCYIFMMSFNLDKCATSNQSNRRWREWWDSIPVSPVTILCATS